MNKPEYSLEDFRCHKILKHYDSVVECCVMDSRSCNSNCAAFCVENVDGGVSVYLKCCARQIKIKGKV